MFIPETKIPKEEMLVPRGSNVIVKPKAEKLSEFIEIANPDQKKDFTGVIVAVGPDVPEDLKVGKMIVYKKYSGQEFVYKRETFVILDASSKVIPLLFPEEKPKSVEQGM